MGLKLWGPQTPTEANWEQSSHTAAPWHLRKGNLKPGTLEPSPYMQSKEDSTWVPQAIWSATESRQKNTNCRKASRGPQGKQQDPGSALVDLPLVSWPPARSFGPWSPCLGSLHDGACSQDPAGVAAPESGAGGQALHPPHGRIAFQSPELNLKPRETAAPATPTLFLSYLTAFMIFSWGQALKISIKKLPFSSEILKYYSHNFDQNAVSKEKEFSSFLEMNPTHLTPY